MKLKEIWFCADEDKKSNLVLKKIWLHAIEEIRQRVDERKENPIPR
jgi:hypothetical protein